MSTSLLPVHPRHRRWAVAASLSVLGGCAQTGGDLRPPQRAGAPIGVQVLSLEPRLREMPFRVLLDFETPADLAFIAGTAARASAAAAHTGRGSLALPAGAQSFSVRLGSLLGGAAFPGQWTLAGAYFYAPEPAQVTVSYEAPDRTLAQRTVRLAGRQWEAVLLDVSALSDPNGPPAPAAGELRFSTAAGSPPLMCDDVVAIDNARSLIPDAERAGGDAWSIRQRGFRLIVERPGTFKQAIPAPEADPDGWRAAEANAMRLRLTGADGKRAWTIYADGREFLDGKFVPPLAMSDPDSATMAQQHRAPAELRVPEELGRVERNAPGDRDNDGYAEQTGAYQLVAFGPRLEATISPRTPALLRPVIEVGGLPPGNVLVNLEGQLVEKVIRLSDGHVLVELPAKLERPTTVYFRVQ